MNKRIPNLKKAYKENIASTLEKTFYYRNKHQVPKLVKINVSSSLGLGAQNKNNLQRAIDEIRAVTGQHPILTKAKKSISGFKIRAGMPMGLLVTLRKEKMYCFLEKLCKLVLPRVRDFRGLSMSNFDNKGNYNLGIIDQLVFPEIEYESADQKRGMTITIASTAKTKEEAKALLLGFGFPFNT